MSSSSSINNAGGSVPFQSSEPSKVSIFHPSRSTIGGNIRNKLVCVENKTINCKKDWKSNNEFGLGKRILWVIAKTGIRGVGVVSMPFARAIDSLIINATLAALKITFGTVVAPINFAACCIRNDGSRLIENNHWNAGEGVRHGWNTVMCFLDIFGSFVVLISPRKLMHISTQRVLDEANEKLDKAQGQIAALNQDIEQLNETIEGQKETINAQNETITERQNMIEITKNQLKKKNKELNSKNSKLAEKKGQLEQLKNQLKNFKAQYDKLASEHKTLSADFMELEKKAYDAQKANEGLIDGMKEAGELREELQQQVNSLKNEINRLNEELNVLRQNAGAVQIPAEGAPAVNNAPPAGEQPADVPNPPNIPPPPGPPPPPPQIQANKPIKKKEVKTAEQEAIEFEQKTYLEKISMQKLISKNGSTISDEDMRRMDAQIKSLEVLNKRLEPSKNDLNIKTIIQENETKINSIKKEIEDSHVLKFSFDTMPINIAKIYLSIYDNLNVKEIEGILANFYIYASAQNQRCLPNNQNLWEELEKAKNAFEQRDLVLENETDENNVEIPDYKRNKVAEYQKAAYAKNQSTYYQLFHNKPKILNEFIAVMNDKKNNKKRRYGNSGFEAIDNCKTVLIDYIKVASSENAKPVANSAKVKNKVENQDSVEVKKEKPEDEINTNQTPKKKLFNGTIKELLAERRKKQEDSSPQNETYEEKLNKDLLKQQQSRVEAQPPNFSNMIPAVSNLKKVEKATINESLVYNTMLNDLISEAENDLLNPKNNFESPERMTSARNFIQTFKDQDGQANVENIRNHNYIKIRNYDLDRKLGMIRSQMQK